MSANPNDIMYFYTADTCGARLTKPVDGRLARSYRTKERITNSFLQLIEGGEMRPTVAVVAETATVSRRAFYLHFNCVEEVLVAAIDQRLRGLSAYWEPFCPLGPLEERVARFCEQWSVVLEELAPLRRAISLHEPLSPALTTAVDGIEQWAAEILELAFLPDMADRCATELGCVTVALRCITSGSMWDQLRRDARSVEESSAVVAHMVTACLTTAAPPSGRIQGPGELALQPHQTLSSGG